MYLCTSCAAGAADILIKKDNISYVPVHFISISNEIQPGDFRKFVTTLQTIPSYENVVVVLSGPGGVLKDAIDIGVVIRKNKIKTIVLGRCFSACAFIALSGYKKALAGTGAILGFHGAYFAETGEISARGNAIVGSHLAKLGYNSDFIAKILEGEKDFTFISQANAYAIATSFKVHFYSLGNEQQALSFLMMN